MTWVGGWAELRTGWGGWGVDPSPSLPAETEDECSDAEQQETLHTHTLAHRHTTPNPTTPHHPLPPLPAETAEECSDAEQQEKRRRFMELRKRHYNMREALKRWVGRVGVGGGVG